LSEEDPGSGQLAKVYVGATPVNVAQRNVTGSKTLEDGITLD
jgi:hypothetical protein